MAKANRMRYLPILLLSLLALTVPLAVRGQYSLRVINLAQLYAVLALGLNFTLGSAGLLSVGHAGFFGIGAYVSALLTARDWNFWPALLVAALSNLAVSVLIGRPILHLKTHYLALATLGFGEIVRLVLLNWKNVTRGTDGIVGIPPPSLLGWTARTEAEKYYFILAFLALAIWVAWRIQESKYGRAFVAMRDSELATEAMGLNTANMKLLAFALSGLYAGLAGSLYAHLFSFISPEAFSFDVTVTVLAGLLIGGAGTVSGPVLGGMLLTFLPEWLRFLKDFYMVIYGVGIVVLIVFLPDGIVGSARRWRRGGREAAPSLAGEEGPTQHGRTAVGDPGAD